jgi:nitrogen fixation protein FixH
LPALPSAKPSAASSAMNVTATHREREVALGWEAKSPTRYRTVTYRAIAYLDKTSHELRSTTLISRTGASTRMPVRQVLSAVTSHQAKPLNRPSWRRLHYLGA